MIWWSLGPVSSPAHPTVGAHLLSSIQSYHGAPEAVICLTLHGVDASQEPSNKLDKEQLHCAVLGDC